MTGADMIVKSLEKLGVEVLFGIPGGTVIPLYDALYGSQIKHVLTRHEQAAAHAADGYARITGRVGACVSTSGPGATNLVTGIATAWMDSVPLVAITGQVATAAIGTDAFQEADIIGITLPVVKHSYQVRDVSKIPAMIAGAFHLAGTGRPGPVLVDLPVDIQKGEAEFTWPESIRFRGYSPEFQTDLKNLPKAAATIEKAARPLIIAGGGVILSEASEILRQCAERWKIPVATSLLGKGAFPESHPLSVGMVGMHGVLAANRAVCEADLILAVGTRFSDRSTGRGDQYGRNANVIQVDVDRAEIDKNIQSDLSLLGDARQVLSELYGAVKKFPKRREWLEAIRKWKEEQEAGKSRGLTPSFILEVAREVAGDDVVVTTEVGQNQMWAAQYFRIERPRRFATSGGLGTMGYGLPAAMGAAFARPGHPVLAIAGDGSLLMNIQELETCVRYRLPVKILLLNNSALGMVRQWQELFYGGRFSETCYASPDFASIARSFGLFGTTVTEESQIRPALKQAFEASGPALVDFRISPEEKVFPMVPPGQAIDEMILEA